MRRQEMAAAVGGFTGYRRKLDERRAALAAAAARPMIADLVEAATTVPDAELEDELCVRLGQALAELDDACVEDHVDPTTFAGAVIDVAVEAVDGALAGQDNGWMPSWRVLVAVAGIVHDPLRERAAEAIDGLRTRPGGNVLPGTPSGPTVAGSVLWTRDAYGSRFGVVAPFHTGEGADRWYLWDIDACGHDTFTVHSRYHSTVDEALADWQAGVGATAADGTAFAPVDDPGLLAELMPRELGFLRPGGESVEQFAEYHRGKRLAEAVLDVLDAIGPRPGPAAGSLDQSSAARLFTMWLKEYRSDRSQQDDLDEVVAELAESWQVAGPAELYHTCSPHRVASIVDHVRGYYQDDFAAEIVALLPDWVAWLSERNGTPAHLADRCMPYAQKSPAVGGADGGARYLERVTE